MIHLILTALILTDVGGISRVQFSEDCESGELQMCVKIVTQTRSRDAKELEEYCKTHYAGMECLQMWIDQCLSEEGQKTAERHASTLRALLHFKCTNNTAIRREYLNEPICWELVLKNWPNCLNQLAWAVEHPHEQSQYLNNIDINAELCSGQKNFISCVGDAGRLCSFESSKLLNRMACVLAQDIAPCTDQPRVCTSSSPSFIAPIITAFYSIILYPVR